MHKIKLKFDKLNMAFTSLEAIYLKPIQEDRSNIDATIQRFEFTFELFWKFLKEFFYQKGLAINYPIDVLKEAFSANIINDELIWIQMLKDRNMTSHTYDEQLADTIFSRIKMYVPIIRQSINYLKTVIKLDNDAISSA